MVQPFRYRLLHDTGTVKVSNCVLLLEGDSEGRDSHKDAEWMEWHLLQGCSFDNLHRSTTSEALLELCLLSLAGRPFGQHSRAL